MIKFTIVLAGSLCWMAGCASSHTSTNQLAASTDCPKIAGTCVAAYYYPNISPFFTEQSHFFSPCQRSLEIQSKQPKGLLLRQLNHDNYSLAGQSAGSIEDLHLDKLLSMAVFYGMSWATELLPESGKASSETVKLEGQWYVSSIDNASGADITLLKSNDTQVNSLVQIRNNNISLLAKSYNFRFHKQLHKNIPYAIDVFDITKGLSSKKLLLQVQYTNMEVRD